MPRMADALPLAEETFRVGSLISCQLCTNQIIEGEVVAWDQSSKVLILKSESKTKSTRNNVQIINLDFVSQVQMKKENPNTPAPTSSLNVQRLQDRAEQKIKEKKHLVVALKQGVTPLGQSLYFAIKKTIEDVSWRNQDILVMDKVLVTKPYTADCVKAFNEKAPEKKAIDHVRKIVEKHMQDTSHRGN